MLAVLHDDVGLGWLLAIVALTVHIRFLLLALTVKQARFDAPDRPARSGYQAAAARARLGSPARPARRWRSSAGTGSTHSRRSYRRWRVPVFLSLYYALRTDLRYDICPGINPPDRRPRSRAARRRHRTLFIPELTSRATGAVLVALIALYLGSQLLPFRPEVHRR